MNRPATRVLRGLAALALLAPLAACGGGADEQRTTVTVYAAASLTSTFERLGTEFEREHPDAEVKLSFGGSSDLVTQIREGAPADVFASADTATMDKLTADGLAAGTPRDFATNTLEIAVPPGNPAHITGLRDLAKPGVDLVVCAPEVPCGAATQAVAERAGVALDPVSQEQSVTDVLAKVTAGEADAGLVYVTDVRAAGDDVEGVEFPESAAVVNTYPIAAVEGSEHADLARQFVDLVLGETGRRVLTRAGFGTP